MSKSGSIVRVLVTGSSDGLGLLAGKRLSGEGHKVILDARDHSRADAARAALPECEAVVVGDVSTLAEMRSVAAQVNELGPMNAVIHNVRTGYNDRDRSGTEDSLSRIFARAGGFASADPKSRLGYGVNRKLA